MLRLTRLHGCSQKNVLWQHWAISNVFFLLGRNIPPRKECQLSDRSEEGCGQNYGLHLTHPTLHSFHPLVPIHRPHLWDHEVTALILSAESPRTKSNIRVAVIGGIAPLLMYNIQELCVSEHWKQDSRQQTVINCPFISPPVWLPSNWLHFTVYMRGKIKAVSLSDTSGLHQNHLRCTASDIQSSFT